MLIVAVLFATIVFIYLDIDRLNYLDIDMEKKYYVYVLCDPRHSGEEWGYSHKPFYVGKGSDRRASRHLEESNKKNIDNLRKHYKIKKMRSEGFEPVIEYHAVDLTEDVAYETETKLIQRYGRKDIDENGILTNLILDGGKPPVRRGPMSDDQKAAIARGNTGKKRTPEQSEYLSSIRKGQKRGQYSEEHRAAISKSLGGDTTSDLTGMTFGLWTVLEKGNDNRTEKTRGASAIFWKCRCSCLSRTEREVSQKNLTYGRSLCCGCRRGKN